METVKECVKEIEKKLEKNTYDMVVFDELSVALSIGLLSREDVERLIQLSKKQSL